MRGLKRALLSLMALAAGSAAAEGERTIAPARSGDVAIRQELDAARRAGTAAAYDQFIARHANHPLARAAREERGRLATGRRP